MNRCRRATGARYALRQTAGGEALEKWMRAGEAGDALGQAYREAVNEAYLAARSAVLRIAGADSAEICERQPGPEAG